MSTHSRGSLRRCRKSAHSAWRAWMNDCMRRNKSLRRCRENDNSSFRHARGDASTSCMDSMHLRVPKHNCMILITLSFSMNHCSAAVELQYFHRVGSRKKHRPLQSRSNNDGPGRAIILNIAGRLQWSAFKTSSGSATVQESIEPDDDSRFQQI